MGVWQCGILGLRSHARLGFEDCVSTSAELLGGSGWGSEFDGAFKVVFPDHGSFVRRWSEGPKTQKVQQPRTNVFCRSHVPQQLSVSFRGRHRGWEKEGGGKPHETQPSQKTTPPPSGVTALFFL